MTEIIDALRARYPGALIDEFGDTEDLSARLIELIRLGQKTAATGALEHYQRDGDPIPTPGDYQIILDFFGTPALILQSEHVEICRFVDVTWDFAKLEGENENFEGWRKDHQAFFERNGGFDPEMLVVCEQFRLIADLAKQDQ